MPVWGFWALSGFYVGVGRDSIAAAVFQRRSSDDPAFGLTDASGWSTLAKNEIGSYSNCFGMRRSDSQHEGPHLLPQAAVAHG